MIAARKFNCACVIAGLLLAAAILPAQTDVVMLWPNGAPGSESWHRKEVEYTVGNTGLRAVRNVVKPSVTVYLPSAANANGASVVIAPGGGFRILSWNSEGTLVADWLQRHGVAAFVLKYRLTDTGSDEEFAQAQARTAAARSKSGRTTAPSTGRAPALPPSEIRAMSAADGLRAIEVVRGHAAEWRIDPAKIGIMGFSAGGYVAVQAALDHTAASRPAFVASIYGCCENPAEIKIPDDAPPIFFLHAYNDPVSVSSPALFQAWQAAKKPAELHSYAAAAAESVSRSEISPRRLDREIRRLSSATEN